MDPSDTNPPAVSLCEAEHAQAEFLTGEEQQSATVALVAIGVVVFAFGFGLGMACGLAAA